MANEANPLLSLSSEQQQQIVDLVDNGNIDQIADKGGMTRRQVLQVAVALGAGATVGGYSVDQIIGEARAAADTSDSDGNVGLPGDRVDLFAEGADISGTATANQVGEQSDRFTGYLATGDVNVLEGAYADKVRAITNGGVVDTIDPDSSSNAVQDAIDAINAASGEGYVLLPPRDIDVGTPITGRERIELRGGGVRATVLKDTDPSTPMFKLDGAADGINSWMGGFSCRTPGATASAPFMDFNSAIRSHNFGAVRFEFRSGSDIINLDSGNINSSSIQWVYATDYNRFITDNTGPAVDIQVAYLNSDDATTPEIELSAGGSLHINSLNKGGTACPVVNASGINTNYFGVTSTRFEPSTSASIDAIYKINDRRQFYFPFIHDSSTDPDHAVQIDRLQTAYIGRCSSLGIEVIGDMFDTGGVIYAGPSSEVTDNAAQTGDTLSTDAITCLGDLTQLA